MPSQNPANQTPPKDANQPLAKEGDIAVFLRRTVSVNEVQVPIYNVAIGPLAEKHARGLEWRRRSYVEVYGDVAGCRLEPEMVLELVKGEEIVLDFPKRDGGSYVATLVNAGQKKETYTNPKTNKTWETTKLNLVKIGHINTQQGEHIGYRVPTPAGDYIEFYKHINSKAFPNGPAIELSARDCYALAEGGEGTEVKTELGTVKMSGTYNKEVKGETYVRASLAMRYNKELYNRLVKEQNASQAQATGESHQETESGQSIKP
jgi:hypothetical protein